MSRWNQWMALAWTVAALLAVTAVVSVAYGRAP
jgi:hypothetical protein